MKASVVTAAMMALLLGLAMGQESEVEQLRADLSSLQQVVADLKKALTDLSRQTMSQQFSAEERARIEADSGIKVIRSRSRGLKNYESPSHVGGAVNAIHNHNNYMRTLGMGEVSVNMNGVNFRTRHNDYKLVMPSTTSREFRATEKVPVPEVPPTVTGTVQEQVDEMVEWFKAFVTQNSTVRDYRKYFIPVLCYMEGTWTLDKDLQEPFSSDRHQIDADSWFQLQERLRFTSYTGSKSNAENLAYLPTSILSVNTTSGLANYAQWNYRILCKPTNRDVPLRMLHYVDDLANRMRGGRTVEDTLGTRAARFKLFDDEQSDQFQILDEIFKGIPGMDNIPFDNLTQATLGDSILLDASERDRVPLKTGHYHRIYKFMKKGAMGQTVNPRGYNDENLWVAQNTQNRVAPITLEVCEKRRGWRKKKQECRQVQNRFSYALPLELVYLTPLLSWNPHDFEIHQNFKGASSQGGDGKKIPYYGADLSHYYLTPYQIFSDKKDRDRQSADTARNTVQVLDKNNNTQKVVASGTRIILPEIPGVGKVRLRYPIAPVSNEGSSVWKELTALKDYVFAMEDKLDKTIPDEDNNEEVEPEDVFFQMSTTVKDPPGEHTHELSVPYKLFNKKLKKGRSVTITSELRQGHTHTIKLRYDRATKKFLYVTCDLRKMCWDEHPTEVTLTTKNKFTEM